MRDAMRCISATGVWRSARGCRTQAMISLVRREEAPVSRARFLSVSGLRGLK